MKGSKTWKDLRYCYVVDCISLILKRGVVATFNQFQLILLKPFLSQKFQKIFTLLVYPCHDRAQSSFSSQMVNYAFSAQQCCAKNFQLKFQLNSFRQIFLGEASRDSETVSVSLTMFLTVHSNTHRKVNLQIISRIQFCGFKNTCSCLGHTVPVTFWQPVNRQFSSLWWWVGLESCRTQGPWPPPTAFSLFTGVFTTVQSTNSIFCQTHHVNKRWEVLSLGTWDYASTVSRMWILKHVVWSHFGVCVCPSLPRVLR